MRVEAIEDMPGRDGPSVSAWAGLNRGLLSHARAGWSIGFGLGRFKPRPTFSQHSSEYFPSLNAASAVTIFNGQEEVL